MDEVDGMSAGDRGGVGALNTLIKKTKVKSTLKIFRRRTDFQIPMVLICNDRTLQKMKPLQSTTFNMTFRRSVSPVIDAIFVLTSHRPQPNEIRSRILSILYK
jgi:replication factor C subunit 1